MQNLIRNVLRIVVAVSMLVGIDAKCPAQSLDIATAHDQVSGNLPELLRFVAQHYRVPVVAELALPLPEHLRIRPGTNSATEVLQELLKSAPDYQFEVIGRNVVHFYRSDITEAPQDFLNLRFRQFTMPPNVSDLKVFLRAKVYALRKGLQGIGVVTSGFGEPELAGDTLPHLEMKDVSGREILLRAAEESPTFYTVLVFLDKHANTEASMNYASQHWFWGSARPMKDNKPMYIQPQPIH